MRDGAAANRYGLVIALIGATYIASIMADSTGALGFVMLLQLITLWLVFTVSESPTLRRIAFIACAVLAVLVLATTSLGYTLASDESAFRVLAVVSAMLYLIAPLMILRHIIRRDVVDARTILGAIAIYLLLGMMFAFTYRAISVNQLSPPFFGDAGPGDNADFLFFSFVSLTTTGYGNLVPAGNPGQTVAVLETIIGQLFLVTALAKIVSAWKISDRARGL